jgi:hypothetical protein
MRKSLTWAAVGTTVAAAALSVAGTASAATATVRPTSLSIEKSVASIKAGAAVTISGQLKSGATALDRQAVVLDWVGPAGHLHYITRGTTSGPTGNVSFKLHPTATTTYELVFAGTWQYGVSKSVPAKVTVTKVPTTLVAVEAAGTKAGTETITGTLTAGPAGLVGEAITLQYKNSKGVWVTRDSKSTGTGGVVVFTVGPKAATTYRLVFTSTPVYTAAVSKTVIAG